MNTPHHSHACRHTLLYPFIQPLSPRINNLFPLVLPQTDNLVQHNLLLGTLDIHTEIRRPERLEPDKPVAAPTRIQLVVLDQLPQALLNDRVLIQHLAIGSEIVGPRPVLPVERVGALSLEQAVVLASDHLDGCRGVDPLDVCFWLLLRGGDLDGGYGGDEAGGGVLLERHGADGVGDVVEADCLVGGQAEVVWVVFLAEIGAVDVQRLAELDGAGAGDGALGVKGDGEGLVVLGGEVGDGDGDGVEDEHLARDGALEVFADRGLEARGLDVGVRVGDAELLDEVEHGLGGDTTAAQGDHGVEAGVVPAADGRGDDAVAHLCALDEHEDAALGEDGAVDAQAAVLALHGALLLGLGHLHVELLQQPVVGDAALAELDSAHGVGDTLERITDAVGEVVGGVDLPPVAGAVVVVLLDDTVCGQIPHLWVALVGVGQALLHAEVGIARLVFAVTHGAELSQRLFDGTRAVLAGVALATVVGAATLHVDLLSCGMSAPDHTVVSLLEGHTRAVAHVCAVLLDELLGQLVQLVEVVAAVGDLPRLKAQPLDDIQDTCEILLLLLLWVRIIIAQVALALVVLREAKVDRDRFAVSDVQVAVGLGWESRVDVLNGLLLVDALEPALGEHAHGLSFGCWLGLLFRSQRMLCFLCFGRRFLSRLLECALRGALLLLGGGRRRGRCCGRFRHGW